VNTSRESVLALIASRNVAPVFQPIVDLETGTISAFEALTRPGPGSGFSDVSELFSRAAQCGLLWELEEVTRNASIMATTSWPEGVRLFFNCTPQVFADGRFRASLAKDMALEGAPRPGRIVLEVTEISDQQHIEGLQEQVRELRREGVEVAIDDVGAGTSGLNRIMHLRPNWLKLDRELIKGINFDSYKQNFVKFFVHFARLSNVNIVAEGIETREELATLATLGIRYGQGYYLGRPATRAQSSSHEFAQQVRDRWAEVEPVATLGAGATPMRRLCVTASVAQSDTAIATVAGLLLRRQDMPGVVVLDGRRFIGWCPRAHLLSETQLSGGRRGIGTIVKHGVCTVSPDATVPDALRVASVRDPSQLSEPLVVADSGEIVGIVRMPDLLSFAAAEAQAGRMPLTGLPGRGRADQHLTILVHEGARAGVDEATSQGDAAFIDIRRFSDYNGAYGYELGDRLIRELASLLRIIVVQDEPGIFLAHLGDDRFMLTAPPGILGQRLRAAADEFDRTYAPGTLHKTPEGDAAASPLYQRLRAILPDAAISLRVLFIPDAMLRIHHPRELYQIEEQLRARSRGEEGLAANAGRSMFITDSRSTPEISLRRTG